MLSTEEVKANLNKAKKALFKYYKDNGLDPSMDFSKDPIHGEMVTNLILRLNRERDKLLRILPIWKMKNILTNIRKRNMAKKIKEEKKAKAAEESSKKVKKTAKKAEVKEVEKKPAKKGNTSLKYDYPLIDGREMTSAEKKKYRMEQRKLQKGDAPKKEKKAKDTPASSEKSKKKEKVHKEVKSSSKDKDKKKKKKVHKDED